MTPVYECRASYEDDRPAIDFQDDENRKNDWLAVDEVIRGIRPIDAFPEVSVLVRHPDATQWDCYNDGGGSGLFSQRFIETVGKESLRDFTLLPGKLNGTTYYFLRCEKRVDCFDPGKAVFKTFKHDPSRIMRILHFEFHSDRLPTDQCFCIPETVALLLTESVVARIRAANLKGLRIQPVP